MRRVVCYSLLFPADHDRSDLLRQLEASVTSLRSHNRRIPVVVFLHGSSSDRLECLAARLDFVVHKQGSYEKHLAAVLPRGWKVLRQYPVLHKFMNFDSIGGIGVDQALLLDCDTIFARDVEILFDRYSVADVYAREEPTCRRSYYGYDPTYIDEAALVSLAEYEGTVTPPPFNLGVVLFNNGRWADLNALVPEFLSYVWRFMIWMALHPPASEVELSFGEGLGVEELRADWDSLVSPLETDAAMQFPSSNRWILEEVAAWLALGMLSGGTYGDFAQFDVVQNGEFAGGSAQDAGWVVCHYFSQNTERIAAWLRPMYGKHLALCTNK